jgi:stage II sporulation protein D
LPTVRRLALALGAVALAAGGAAASLLASGLPAATGTTTATTAAATTTVETAPTVVAFTGHGWGHGLGLSQWGAYGYALHGWTYGRILAHYYPGTTLGPARGRVVRVLVAAEKKVTLTATAPWAVVDASGARTVLDAGTLTVGPALRVRGARLQAPLTFTSAQPLAVDGRAYRGRIVLAPDAKVLDVVDAVALEQYLKAVVPSEMPSAWPPEALKAQAVAARSYALANLAHGRPYDLYGDARSQVYGGVAAESPAASAAVAATRGQVVLYAGKVADTLFFSTSGGRTASALESTGIDVPYLVSVADPYDTLSPYHDWGPVLIDAAGVAAKLKLSAPVVALDVTDGPSGRVASVVATAADESRVTLTGNQVRTALDLRSTWFAPAVFRLQPAAKTMTFGGAVSLSGAVQGADGVSLEAKPAGRDWSGAGDLVLGGDGAFATIVRPPVTTSYRLAWGSARVGLARITVAARVSAVAVAAGVQGTVRPAAPAAPVQLQQQQADGTWTAVASTTADASSAWSFAGPLAPGTYRVRVVPGNGVAAGLSPPVAVS